MVAIKCCTRRNHELTCSLHLKIQNPLNLHEIPEWSLQTANWMGIFHPRNWLCKKLVIHQLSLFTNANFSNDQKHFSWLIPIFYKHNYPSNVTNPFTYSRQFELGCVLKTFHVSSFPQPSIFPQFKQGPIELSQIT